MRYITKIAFKYYLQLENPRPQFTDSYFKEFLKSYKIGTKNFTREK